MTVQPGFSALWEMPGRRRSRLVVRPGVVGGPAATVSAAGHTLHLLQEVHKHCLQLLLGGRPLPREIQPSVGSTGLARLEASRARVLLPTPAPAVLLTAALDIHRGAGSR